VSPRRANSSIQGGLVRDQRVIMAGECPGALDPHTPGDHSCLA
jgi:hypothetical protein